MPAVLTYPFGNQNCWHISYSTYEDEDSIIIGTSKEVPAVEENFARQVPTNLEQIMDEVYIASRSIRNSCFQQNIANSAQYDLHIWIYQELQSTPLYF